MKTRNVIGQRIVRVKQSMGWNNNNQVRENFVEYIELENGVRLIPITIETDDEYGHEFSVTKPNKRGSQDVRSPKS